MLAAVVVVLMGGGGTGLLAYGALPVGIFGPWGGISAGLSPPANADRAGGGAGCRGVCLIARRGCCGFSLRLASSIFHTVFVSNGHSQRHVHQTPLLI